MEYKSRWGGGGEVVTSARAANRASDLLHHILFSGIFCTQHWVQLWWIYCPEIYFRGFTVLYSILVDFLPCILFWWSDLVFYSEGFSVLHSILVGLLLCILFCWIYLRFSFFLADFLQGFLSYSGLKYTILILFSCVTFKKCI